ncbi:MAG: hypothetical protein WC867_06155 [Candidatus Pacearchaeota archaeon]|jgi:acetylglutamate synthase
MIKTIEIMPVRKKFIIEEEPLELQDPKKISELIKKVFGNELRKEFFYEGDKNIHFYSHESKYRGIVIVMPNIKDIATYLDIIAVDCEYKGKGLGKDLFESIINIQENPKLFWRSRVDRLANDWYKRKSDEYKEYSTDNKTNYNLYTIGLSNNEKEKALEFVKKRQSNFIE